MTELGAGIASQQRSRLELERLAEVFERAPVAICVLRGPDLVYELINPAYQALLPNRPILGLPLAEVVPEMDPAIRAVVRRVLETGEPFQAGKLYVPIDRDQDGVPEEAWFNLVYQPLTADHRGIPGVIVIAIDITAQVQATQEIERQWHVFDTALSNSPDFCYVFDLDGRFTYMNQALLALWQKTYDEAVGKNFFELEYPPDLAGRLQDQIQQVIRTREPLTDETPFEGPTGESRMYEYIFVPIVGKDGVVAGVAGSTRDITDRKQVERVLRESEYKLRELLNEKEVLVREVHHRVKNNLQIILSLLNLHAGYTTDGRVLGPLSEAAGRVRTIARLHERLYTSINLAEIEFGEYLRALTDELRELHDRPEITVHVQTEHVIVDFEVAIALGLIANELIVNSFKHAFPSGRGGHVTVTLGYLFSDAGIAPSTETRLLRLMVIDDGIGFPPGSEAQDSSSMGLHLVRLLVEQLHAQLDVRTVTGVEFAVTFPLPAVS